MPRLTVRDLQASDSKAALRLPERSSASRSSRGRSSRATSNAQTSPFAAGELRARARLDADAPGRRVREASANGRSVPEKMWFVPLTVPTGQRLFAQGK